jgi:uncharacterized protein (DUF697 family)
MVRGIIRVAAAAAAVIAGERARISGADVPALVRIQTAMIVAIAEVHGTILTERAAADLLASFAGSLADGPPSHALVGGLPCFGNAINAATAASFTEAVGWSAEAYFRDDAATPAREFESAS